LTALHEERGLRELEAYYFHNCVYDAVYKSARMLRADAVPTGDLLGRLDPRRTSPTPGIYWLHQIAAHFDRGVWVNPEPPHDWDGYPTARVIRRLFPMFHLSVDGLADAVQALVGART